MKQQKIQETFCHPFLQLRSLARLAPGATFGVFHWTLAFPLQKPNSVEHNLTNIPHVFINFRSMSTSCAVVYPFRPFGSSTIKFHLTQAHKCRMEQPIRYPQSFSFFERLLVQMQLGAPFYAIETYKPNIQIEKWVNMQKLLSPWSKYCQCGENIPTP